MTTPNSVAYDEGVSPRSSKSTAAKPLRNEKGRARYLPVSPEAERFGRAVAEARLAAGVTQAWVGQQMTIPVSQATVAAWEHGVNLPAPEVVFDLERVLVLSPGSLSHWLGFLPVTGPRGVTPQMVTEAILRDDNLDETGRNAMLGLYNNLRKGTRNVTRRISRNAGRDANS